MSTKHWLNRLSAATVAASLIGCPAAFAAGDSETKPHSADAGTAIGDTAITAKVKTKFATDTRLDNSEITVNTANGVVTLTGSAPSLKAKEAAGDLAKNIDGVVRVDNQLVTPQVEAADAASMESGAPPSNAERVASDSWITAKVKAALLADHTTKGLEISVKTVQHVVHLTGTVGSQAEIDRAKELAKGIKHVKSVDTSGLKIGAG